MGKLVECPRCSCNEYEILVTHSFCWQCDYCPDLNAPWEPSIPKWVRKAVPDAFEEEEEPETCKKPTKNEPELCLKAG